MKFSEIAIYSQQIKQQYPDYATNPIVAEMVAAHPDYSHNTIRQSWEANNIYFHCEGSPTGVSHCITFDKEMLPYLHKPLDVAINNKY